MTKSLSYCPPKEGVYGLAQHSGCSEVTESHSPLVQGLCVPGPPAEGKGLSPHFTPAGQAQAPHSVIAKPKPGLGRRVWEGKQLECAHGLQTASYSCPPWAATSPSCNGGSDLITSVVWPHGTTWAEGASSDGPPGEAFSQGSRPKPSSLLLCALVKRDCEEALKLLQLISLLLSETCLVFISHPHLKYI